MKTEQQVNEAAYLERMGQLGERYEEKLQEIYHLQSDQGDIDRERLVEMVGYLAAKAQTDGANPAPGVNERAIFKEARNHGGFCPNRNMIYFLVRYGQLAEISTKTGRLYCLPSQVS